jgi:flagellar M-ring protein FliF
MSPKIDDIKNKLQSVDKGKLLSLFEKHKHFFIGGLVGLIAFVAILSFVFISSSKKEGFAPLFTNLNPSAVEEVVKELTKEGISFKVSSDGRTVYVPKDLVYSTRISLASKGIPSSGRISFDLFKEPKFGMSKYQMKILYQQALANELAKSIETLSPVKSAKVVISFPEETSFLSNEEPRASAVVELYPGESLTREQIKGIVNLLVKSVKGLKPKNVSVVDQFGNDLAEDIFKTSTSEEVEKKLKIKRKMEREIESKVMAMLAKVFGASRVSVKANVDLDFTQEEVEEQFYDPDKSAIVSEKREKETSTTSKSMGGIPGSTSNLPPPVGRDFDIAGQLGGTGGKTGRVEKKKSIVNYNTGEIKRKRVLNSPTVRRITVSVLVSGKYVVKDGRVRYVPLTDEEIQEIDRAVKTAVGYNPSRGDVVTVASLPFENVAESTKLKVSKEISVTAPVKRISKKLGVPQWVLLSAVGALLLILIALLTFFLFKRRREKEREIAKRPIEELLTAPAPAEKPEERIETFLQELDTEKVPVTLSELSKLVPGLKVEDLRYEPESVKVDRTLNAILKHIEAKIKENPKKAAEIIRRWLNS